VSDLTPVQRIEAAIQRLETLRDRSTPGPWAVEDGWQPPQWDVHTYVRVVGGEPNKISGIRHPIASTNGAESQSAMKRQTLAEAHLIVTLHRTIDAQLAILRHSLARALSKIEHGGRTEPVWSHEHDALALADAINADLGTVQA